MAAVSQEQGANVPAGEKMIRVVPADNRTLLQKGLRALIGAESDLKPVAEGSAGREAIAQMNLSGRPWAPSGSKHRLRSCLAAVCFLRIACALSAAEPTLVRLAVGEGKDVGFAHLTSKEGLSPGQVRGIVQDDQGFLWINTTGVLNRYDGYQFKNYTRDPAHPNYPAGGFIQILFKDRSGFLWVSSNESLDRFDPTTETTTHFRTDRNGPDSALGPVLHISQDRAGILWLSTRNGLHRLDPASGAFRHFDHDPADPDSLSSSFVRSSYEDRRGTLWVCTVAGLDAFDRRTGKVTERIRLELAESRTVKALEDHAGVLWIVYSFGNGLASYDRNTRNLTLYSFEDKAATLLSGAEGIYEDADGNLWVATRESGLLRIDPNRRSAVRYTHSNVNPDSISEDFLKAVFEDHEGSIWVGMGTTGLNYFQRKPLPFKRYRHEPGNARSLLETFVMAVYADSQENIWVGSPLGVTRIDGKSGEYSFFKKPGSHPANLSNTTSIIEDRSGYLWFGTFGGGLKRYDPKTARIVAFRHNPADPHSLSHDVVFSLIVDRQGILWVGTDNGLNRCEDPVTGRFRSWKGDPADPSPTDVRAMAMDSSGVLWLVTTTLQRFDQATGRFIAYMFDDLGTGTAGRIESPFLVKSGRRLSEDSFLTIDPSGVLWIATANGLLRFDRKLEQFTLYDQRDGLAANSVNGILADRNENLWVSTAGGLSRFNPRTRTFTNYHEADGLAGNAFEGFPAAGQSRRGQMFFGSKSGLTSFWPEQIVEKPSIPPVVFTGFSLRNVPVTPGPGSTLAKSISYTPSLTLSPDQNLFSFEFAALSYADPQRNQFRYMLEPLDRSWNRVDAAHRMAAFTTLPAGKYTLRVQGSNNRGVWNEQGVALYLQILPPWWGTWWFRGVCAVVFVALLWGAYQYRILQLQREFEMRLAGRVEERTRIARELHDTLLQSVQGLMFSFQAARNLLPGRTEEAMRTLDGAIQKGDEAIAEGRDAIQGLRANPALESDLEHLLTAAGEELARSSTAEGELPAFQVTVEGARQPLSPLLQDEVYRIAREILRNAFHHAQATRIEAQTTYDGQFFRLRIRDDGKGIDRKVLEAGARQGHWGLPGVRERAKRIGAELNLWSEVGAGTEAELTIPARIAYRTVHRRQGLQLFRNKKVQS
jgi:ligand-binding sensor domain-containing protein/signal transduction histidine kinase